jgi:FkbM family methyltransferase
MTSLVKRNIAANLLGRGWSVLLTLALVPLYFRLLGPEAYGLIGVYVTLSTLAVVAEPGFGTMLTRELARREALPGGRGAAADTRDLLRTLEAITLCIALGLAALVLLASPWIAHRWLGGNTLDGNLLQQAVALMGLALACQWPTPFYSGALTGTQRLVALNAIVAAGAAVRGAGSLALLVWVEPDIRLFLAWQAAGHALQSLLLGTSLWRQLLGDGRRARFRLTALDGLVPFTFGVWAISLLGILTTQADKVLLSTLLPLAEFGYYTLAGVVASTTALVIAPIIGAVSPRLSALAAGSDRAALSDFYHATVQLIAVATLPVAATLAVFSHEAMLVWSGDLAIADATAPIVTALAIGTALSSLVNAPYAVMLAHGRSRLGVWFGLVTLAVALPALWLGASRYGAQGAAAAYALVCALNLLVCVSVLHAVFLPGHGRAWLLRDILPAIAGAGLVILAARWSLPTGLGRLPLAVLLGVTLALATVAAVLCAGTTRRQAIRFACGILGRGALAHARLSRRSNMHLPGRIAEAIAARSRWAMDELRRRHLARTDAKAATARIPPGQRGLFIDCGSNLGQGFAFFRQHFRLETFDYVLVEPNPNCLDALQQAIQASGFGERIDLIPKAAGAGPGTAKFYGLTELPSRGTSDGASILKDHNSKFYAASDDTALEVETFSLAALIRERRDAHAVIVLKIDIEGGEYDVLEQILATGTQDALSCVYAEFHSQYMTDPPRASYLARERAIVARFAAHRVPLRLWT